MRYFLFSLISEGALGVLKHTDVFGLAVLCCVLCWCEHNHNLSRSRKSALWLILTIPDRKKKKKKKREREIGAKIQF